MDFILPESDNLKIECFGRLYIPNLSRQAFEGQLSEIILPVYNSAKAAGFIEWEYNVV